MSTPHRTITTGTAARIALVIGISCFAPFAGADALDNVLMAQAEADNAASASQERINKIYDATQDAAQKYRQALADTDSFKLFIANQAKQVEQQKVELGSIQKQLSEIERTQREVEPLMQRMLDTLEQFVAADVPFLKEERADRVNRLKEAMGRVDVTVSEKYRRILEAYQIEMEYGRTLDYYQGKIEGDRTVNFVRVGRIALLYQTIDGKESGYWNSAQKKFDRDDSYHERVKEALRVAQKQGAPDLLVVPVPTPTEVQS